MASNSEIAQIKEKLNIHDVVSSYIKLKRSGSNYFGICPFHSEKSPSFSVNEELGIFKCFGCQESGDIIAFVQKIENLTFGEAIEKLANQAGVHLTNTFEKDEDKSKKNRILEANNLALKLFTYLINEKQGEVVKTYLQKRNITEDSIKEFSLGYDFKNTLVNLLLKRGFTKDEIIKYGFGVVRSGVLVDKYRGRLIFPIFGVSGDVVGFSGRLIEVNEGAPKYINSPETEVFKKSNVLYGLNITKKYIKESDNALLLEGPIDVITAYQNGIKNVCAAQGTSLTEGHLKVLRRFSNNVTFCFDQDTAGFKALTRSFALAEQNEINAKMIKINDAKDIDEKANKDKEGLLEDVSNPLDIIEYFISKYVEENNTSIVEGKLKVINNIIPFISLLHDNIKKSFYIQKLADAVQVDEDEVKKMINIKNDQYKKEVIKNIEKNITAGNLRLEYLLAIFLQFYKSLHTEIENFESTLIYNLDIRAVFIKLQASIEEGVDIKQFIESLEGHEKELCINLMTINLRKINTEDIGYIQKEIKSLETILRKKFILSQINDLKNKLWMYEQENDEDKINYILESISKLAKEI